MNEKWRRKSRCLFCVRRPLDKAAPEADWRAMRQELAELVCCLPDGGAGQEGRCSRIA